MRRKSSTFLETFVCNLRFLTGRRSGGSRGNVAPVCSGRHGPTVLGHTGPGPSQGRKWRIEQGKEKQHYSRSGYDHEGGTYKNRIPRKYRNRQPIPSCGEVSERTGWMEHTSRVASGVECYETSQGIVVTSKSDTEVRKEIKCRGSYTRGSSVPGRKEGDMSVCVVYPQTFEHPYYLKVFCNGSESEMFPLVTSFES